MSGCIHHTATKDKQGYGRYNKILLHRLAYCTANQCTLESIKGLLVRHTCDTPSCINPQHLLLGSHKDNTADMLARGRGPSGEKGGLAKLTWEQAATIRARYVPRHPLNGCRALAKEFGGTPADFSYSE